eukprot:9012866-Karenia_brevis.AAC.1
MFLRFSQPGSTYFSDSAFVVDGVLKRGAKATTAASAPWAEIWRMVWHMVADWGGVEAVGLQKVKGHASTEDLAAGRITKRCKYGNGFADKRARQAARRCGASEQAVQRHAQE